jgi:hypothetical protein
MNRQLRRIQASSKNGHGLSGMLGKLEGALGELQKVPQLGHLEQAAQGVKELVGELTTLRDELKTALAEIPDYEVELGRQRAVFLRFLFYPDILLTPGEAGIGQFLSAEQRYRAEYDAMLFLVKLVTWAKEAP